MKIYKVILVALLVGVTIFSVFKYVSSLKEKRAILEILNQTKDQLQALEQENLGLKDSLKVTAEKLAKKEEDFNQARQDIQELTSEIAILKSENTSLKEEEVKLKAQLTSVSQEKDNLQARLSSIAELKKAIRELKRQMRVVRKKIEDKIIYGNRGYLIKDGKPTYPAQVKIEVISVPAPLPQSEK